MFRDLRTFIQFAVGIAFATCCSASNAVPTFIVNGQFDLGAGPFGWQLVNGANSQGAGGNPGSYVILNKTPNSAPAAALQMIQGLTPGSVYEVGGDFQTVFPRLREEGGPGIESFGISIDGIYIAELFRPNLANGICIFFCPNWATFSATFTATASQALLSIAAGINSDNTSYAIDNISVRELDAPPVRITEPSTQILMFGFAFASIRMMRRHAGGTLRKCQLIS